MFGSFVVARLTLGKENKPPRGCLVPLSSLAPHCICGGWNSLVEVEETRLDLGSGIPHLGVGVRIRVFGSWRKGQ